MEFLVRGATVFDEPGVCLSFEETAEELATNVESLGFDVPTLKPFRASEIFDCMAQQPGMLHRRALTVPEPQDISELKAADLASLPADLRAELRQGLISLDVKRISGAIERAASSHAALGATLKEPAGRFAFTEMLRAVETSLETPA